MGKSWGGGKGDESRVSNHKAYRDSPLWKKKTPLYVDDNIGYIDPIDTNEEHIGRKKRQCLFLDDLRYPQNAYLWGEKKTLYEGSGIINWNWSIVRSYDQFVEYIEKNGIPDVVSFDNDLCEVSNPSISNEELIKQYAMIDWENSSIKTGAHCAKYLIEQCVLKNAPIPEYYVHTANSAARPIIIEIMEEGIRGYDSLQRTLQ